MSKCGKTTEVYSRVCGYFRPVSNWNKGKKEEFANRKTYNVLGMLVAVFTLVAIATGCGHNFGVNSKGVGVRMAWNPDSIMPEFTMGYYEVGSIAIRENAEGLYESDSVGTMTGDAIDGETSGTLGTKLSITTGQQANGYTTKNELLGYGFGSGNTNEVSLTEKGGEVVVEINGEVITYTADSGVVISGGTGDDGGTDETTEDSGETATTE